MAGEYASFIQDLKNVVPAKRKILAGTHVGC